MSENEYYIIISNNNIVLLQYTSHDTWHKQQPTENEHKEQKTEQD